MLTRHYVLFQLIVSNLQIHYVGNIPFSFHEQSIMIIFSQKTFTNWSDREALQKMLKRIINECFFAITIAWEKLQCWITLAPCTTHFRSNSGLSSFASPCSRAEKVSHEETRFSISLAYRTASIGPCLRSLRPYFPSRPFTRKKGLLLDDWIRAWQVLAVKPIVGEVKLHDAL